jgi:hypothetical protein
MNQIKFRAWHNEAKEYCEGSTSNMFSWIDDGQPITLEQFIGFKDKGGVNFCVGDIGEFSNGDRFIVSLEDWLEIYIDWIGEPECEDQARDLYRIGNATIIGNIHQNPELIE